MAALPDDILNEVFSYLPAKSVWRFRSLSRSWRAALSSASFLDLHRRRANRPGQLKVFFIPTNQTLEEEGSSYFYAWQPGDAAAKKLVPLRFERPSILTKPLHGLVLIRCIDTGYHICNPSTSQALALRDTNKPIRRPPWHWSAALPCYHYRRVAYGFGYCSVTGLHMAVRLFSILIDQDSEFGPNCCEIFAPDKFPYWRRTAQQPPACIVDEENPGVFLNGRVHYLCSDDGGIFTFDVSSETFGSLLPPPSPKDARTKMTELDGRLCVFQGDMCYGDDTYYIWSLTNYEQQQWGKLCRIDPTVWTEPDRWQLQSWWTAPLGLYNRDNGHKKIVCGTSTCQVFAVNVPNGDALEIMLRPDEATIEDYCKPGLGILEESLLAMRWMRRYPTYNLEWGGVQTGPMLG